MNDLIERLEKATGSDREIGNEVLLACGWKLEEDGEGPDRALFWVNPDPNGEDYNDGDQPNPTFSIDVALRLVPDHWRTDWAGQVPMGTQWFWELTQMDANRSTERVWAPTAPLAICIAALKARALREQSR